ncbi:hypothetical protein [Erythrobacter sp. F6033]|uniref:hypothetical protein n=1 Tax=Erythrobacter sp. F6033 TaxID=2926401 RepID=UPI001FF1C0BD|nr:hypothetical protein [Erythrobacter sp. F6033]MCK0128172.1 hypothetical protein [Erythrobacter sp. F6033]
MPRKANPRTARLPVPAGQIPDFTPVPRQRMRNGGWSAARQREFIELLAETGSVRAACRRLGVGEHHIYKLRRHPEAESFRKAWEAALDLGIARIEDVAMDRALNGVEEPVYHAGEIVGTRRVYNDRLLMFLLKNRAPSRFAADARPSPRKPDAIETMQEKRRAKQLRRKLKAEIRAEMEAEAEANAPSPQEIRASIDAKIEGLRRAAEYRRKQEWEALSEDTREAWERYDALKTRDMGRIAAEEEARRTLLEGPREQVNAVPPEEKVVEPKPPKTVWSLKDDGWE